jgi:endonuclease YncB( thermonuclease family)
MKYQIASVVAIASLAITTPAGALDFTGRVINVEHGSRLKVRTANNKEIVVQLVCLDAPDVNQSPWGQTAINQLKKITPVGTIVNIKITGDEKGELAGVVTRDGESVNVKALATGTAVLSEAFIKKQAGALDCIGQRQEYSQAQAVAIVKKEGFWKQGCPIMPWQARAGVSKELACNKPAVYTPGTCQQLRDQEIYGPFYRDEKDPNYSPARDPDRDGVACEGYYIDRTNRPTPIYR